MNIKLLKLISKDSRTSTADLATMLGITEDEVRAEIAELEHEGVIRGYKAVIDWDRLDSAAYVSAIIELKDGEEMTEEELLAFCQELPRYKRPRKVIFADIPRNPTGKIEKPVLRRRYGAGNLIAEENEIKR